MSRPLAGNQTLHHRVNLAFRPSHGAGSEFHRFGEHPLAYEVEEAAAFVADAVKNFIEADKAFTAGRTFLSVRSGLASGHSPIRSCHLHEVEYPVDAGKFRHE